jgi:hypothetical protein
MQRFTVEDGRAGLDMKRMRAVAVATQRAVGSTPARRSPMNPLRCIGDGHLVTTVVPMISAAKGTAPGAVQIRNAEAEPHEE